MEFASLYKIFILNVQGKYTNYIRGVQGYFFFFFFKGFQGIMKNSLTYFPWPRMRDISHISHIHYLITHLSYSLYLTRT